MSKEDLKDTNPQSKIRFEHIVITKPRPHSRPEAKGVAMKENSVPVRHESESGERASPPDAATPTGTTTTSASYSYLNNPRVNFGSEVPHTLNSDATRLNAPSSATSTNRNESTSMLERIAFPYKLLRKYIASLPDTIYGTSETVKGTRDVGTVVQTMSLFLNGQNLSEDNGNNAPLKNFMEIPSSIEPLKASKNGTRPVPLPVSHPCEKPAVDEVGVQKVPPIVELLYAQVPAGGERKNYDGAKANTLPEVEHETTVTSDPSKKKNPTSTDAEDAASTATPHGRSLAGSAKSTDLFEAISKHVLSIASPGQSYDAKHNALPRFRNQTSPPFTDSLFLRGRQGGGSSITLVDTSITPSSEETLMSEQLENITPFELSRCDTNLSEQYSAHPTVVDNRKVIGKDHVFGLDTKGIIVMELPNQLSLHDIFNEQYLSGQKKHSFFSTDLKAQTSGESTCSIDRRESFNNEEQEVTHTSGSDMHSDHSSSITILNKQTNVHLVGEKPAGRLKNAETEPATVGNDGSLNTVELPAQLSLHNLFDEDYLSGRKKHSFNCSTPSNRHTSDDDTTVSSLEYTDGTIQDINNKSGHERKGEKLSVLELRSLMSKHGLLEEKKGNKKRKTKAKPLESNHNIKDSVQGFTSESSHQFKAKTPSVQNLRSKISIPCLDDSTVNGKGKIRAQSSESIRINFDDSVQVVGSSPGCGKKGESSSVQELRSLMSKHGLLNDKNANEKMNTKAQPSRSIRINFDDSIELTSISAAQEYLLSHVPVHEVLEDQDTSAGKTQPPSESMNKHNNDIASKESTPTIVLYREESVVPHYKEPSQKKKESVSTRRNANAGLTNQRDDSITVGITDPDSSEENLPLKRTPDGIMRDKTSNMERKDKKVKIDSTSTNESNLYENKCGSEEMPKTISNYLFNDEKMLCKDRKSSRDLHGSMLNTEIMSASDSSWGTPIAVYRSTSESNEVAYATSVDSIDDSESRRERRQSRGRRRSSKPASVRDGPPGEDAVSPETTSASFESGEAETPEDSMDESASGGSDDSPKSDSLANWSPISVGSSASESVVPGGAASGPEFSPKASSPMDWSSVRAATGPGDDATKPGDLLDDDEFESTFKFSQLQFPTDDPVSEPSETSDASFRSTSEPSADEERTTDSSIAEDARTIKFLTTGSVKSSSDIDEKLSEAHGHSKTGFNKYENSNEERLDLGTKGSGHMPRPREMLSIYSRGVVANRPSATNAKSSPSLNIKIKPALRKNSDTRNNNNNNTVDNDEECSAAAVASSSNRSVGRSVSFSEKRTEFPWSGTQAVSTPISVTPAKVEADSPLADKERGSRSEEMTATEGNATADDAAREDGHGQRDNEPKKDASKQQQVAAGGKRRSSSVDAGGKRAKSRQRVQDEEPKRSNSDDANQTSLFSLDNIMPYMRMFFTPVMDEVALDTLHVLRGDPGCELCAQRHQEDETEARVVPRQEGGESGDEERPRGNEENSHKQQAKEESDRRQSHNKEQERRRSSHKDKEEKDEDGKDKRRRSSQKDQEKREEGEDKRRRSSSKNHEKKEKEVEDDTRHQEGEEEEKKHSDEGEGVEEESKERQHEERVEEKT